MGRRKKEPIKIQETQELFWCNRGAQWLYRSVCLSRRKRKVNGCVKCKQGRLLQEAVEGKKK